MNPEQFAELARAMGVEGIRVVHMPIAETADPRAHMFFRHAAFPDALFAYRSTPGSTGPHEGVWLAEELATGALHRIMRGRAVSSADGIVWLQLLGQRLVAEPTTSDPRPGRSEAPG